MFLGETSSPKWCGEMEVAKTKEVGWARVGR